MPAPRLVLAVGALALAATPALAKKRPPPPPAGPRIVAIKDVTTTGCGTDGGSVTCSSGVRYLGDLVRIYFTNQLNDKAIDCAADAKAGSVTFHFGYEYNDGTVNVSDDPKVQAKWPACVKDLTDQIDKKYLEWWKMLQPIDPSVDVRSGYKVTLTIKK